MKNIYAITMPNGDVYGVQAEAIADYYASYCQREYDEDYYENYDAMMSWFQKGDYKFADWTKNNMDWNDVKDKAVLLKKNEETVDFQDGWVNGRYEYRKCEED